MTANIADLIAKLQVHLAELGDGRDARSDNEKAAWWTRCTETQRTVTGLKNAPDDLAKLSRLLADLEARRAAYLAKQAALAKEVADAPDWRSFADGRARDAEWDRQQGLKTSLQLLSDGRLFAAPGVTYGTLKGIDTRIAELTERRDRAQHALDAHLKAAEALLAVTVTK